MNLQDIFFIAIGVIFMLMMIAFAIRYYKLLTLAQNEYERAKNIISEIILTFKRRLDKQGGNIDQITFQMETTHSTLERLISRLQGVEDRVIDITKISESVSLSHKEVINRVDTLKKEADKISENQQTLQKQFFAFEESIQAADKKERLGMVNEDQSFLKLTETERIVLQFLSNEGAKTAPEVEEKVGKTREHTARLMKKLWQEGYIERDTHRIPFVYRITENLKKMEIKDTNTL